MAAKQSTHQDLVKPGLPKIGETKSSNDQVSQDLAKAKQTGEKVANKVKEAISPVLNQEKGVIQSITSPARGMFDSPLAKKIVRIVLVVILLLVLMYIVSLLVKTARQNGEIATTGGPTPTIAPYTPTNPSIYAEDELVLQLEEDIKVLDRELSTVQLKETTLTPPVLDFDVNFKE